ncbi:hypothetical protein [Novosphingobium sp. M1R2S20]|uniref:Uncharacterized protein n=1 Tax=Novosphingobium rhizovicinum TaxID=3228928 RepID=A0ABV3REB2_9SPHN
MRRIRDHSALPRKQIDTTARQLVLDNVTEGSGGVVTFLVVRMLVHRVSGVSDTKLAKGHAHQERSARTGVARGGQIAKTVDRVSAGAPRATDMTPGRTGATAPKRTPGAGMIKRGAPRHGTGATGIGGGAATLGTTGQVTARAIAVSSMPAATMHHMRVTVIAALA